MQLSRIINKLGKYHPKQALIVDPDVDIFFFQLSEKEKSLKQNALYICNVSQLPPLPLENGLSFLCIKDIELPKSYAAPENKLNLITVDRSINTYDAIGILSRIFSDDSRINHARNCLINALHSGKGLQHIVNEAFKLLQNPIIVSDIGYKILAMSRSNEENEESESSELSGKDLQRNLGYLIEDNIATMKREKIHEHIRETRAPYFSMDSSEKCGRINSLVYIHGIEVAEVGVLGSRHSIDDVDIETTDFLCKIIAFELQKYDFYQNNQGLMHSFLLFDLLNGQITNSEILNERMHNLGWKLQEKLAVMLVADLSREIFDGKAQIICKQLNNLISTSRWVIFDGKIVFLMSFKEKPDVENNSRLIDYLDKNHLVASISSVFSNILDINKHYLQAGKAFELGTKLHVDNSIYNYEDYMIYHIGDIVAQSNDLSDFYHPGVVAVREYDKNHNSNFLETLELFLEYTEKTHLIASHLYIHKNTVLYRINKLKDQFNLDLSNGEERLKIFFTIKLMKLE